MAHSLRRPMPAVMVAEVAVVVGRAFACRRYCPRRRRGFIWLRPRSRCIGALRRGDGLPAARDRLRRPGAGGPGAAGQPGGQRDIVHGILQLA